MPRLLRAQAPGTYHVYAKAVSCRPLFADAAARRLFLRLLAVAAERNVWRVEMYCLLTTHYHVLIRIEEANLARGMQWLNGIYGASINTIERDHGHVFGARYGSRSVTTDAHLLELIRYLALNPVRAGLCSDPVDWPWGSYRHLVRTPEMPTFLDADAVLSLFGGDRTRARRRLEAFVRDGLISAA